MIRMRARPGTRGRGAAAVETALVLPILLFVLFGLVDFGRMYNLQLKLTEAAREGARAATVGQSASGRVTSFMAGTTTTTTVTYASPDGSVSYPSCPAAPTIADATVTTTSTFQFITPMAALASLFRGRFNDTAFTVTGKGVMTCNS